MARRDAVARRRLEARLWPAIALLLITALAALLRFWRLDSVPPGFHYDEAYEALEAWRVLTQPSYHPIFFAGNFGVEPAFIYLTALAFKLASATPQVMRSVAGVVGTLTVPALYALSRELVRDDERMPAALPLLAALALAINRWHLHFSRVGIEPVLVPLLLTLMLWAFWHARRMNRLLAWVAFGVLAGLGPYTYPAGRLLPVIALALGLWVTFEARAAASPTPSDHAKTQRRKVNQMASPRLRVLAWSSWSNGRPRMWLLALLLLAGLAALVVLAPLALHWAQHPEQLLLRSSQIASAPSGASGSNPTRNLLATLGMFSFRGDLDPRNNQPGMPVLDILMSIPFFVGLAAALWRWRRLAFGGILLAGLVMLVPTVFSEYAPHFRRALGAAPVTALLCGLGVAILLGREARGASALRDTAPVRLRGDGASAAQGAAGMDRLAGIGRAVIVGVILVGSLASTAAAYFGRWANSPALFYAYDQGLWEIGQYVLSLPPDEAVYITPRPATDTTLAFAWRQGRTVRHFDGRHAFIAAPPDQTVTYIVIEHEDFRGGPLVRALYPAAVEAKVFHDRANKVYARALRLEAGAAPARLPEVRFQANWPGIALVGYDLDQAEYRPGDIVYLQLWWRATARSEMDWTVFTHLLGPAKADGSTVWAGRDARPGNGSIPTTIWAAGDLILDEYQIQLSLDVPAGSYEIEMGLYAPGQDGARLKVLSASGKMFAEGVIIGTVVVK